MSEINRGVAIGGAAAAVAPARPLIEEPGIGPGENDAIIAPRMSGSEPPPP